MTFFSIKCVVEHVRACVRAQEVGLESSFHEPKRILTESSSTLYYYTWVHFYNIHKYISLVMVCLLYVRALFML